jgi:hypothetical protein
VGGVQLVVVPLSWGAGVVPCCLHCGPAVALGLHGMGMGGGAGGWWLVL